jgi:hypothetical protein
MCVLSLKLTFRAFYAQVYSVVHPVTIFIPEANYKNFMNVRTVPHVTPCTNVSEENPASIFWGFK